MTKFGHTGEDNYLEIGINAKISELHAAMGLAVLPHVESIISERRQCSLWYDEYLQASKLRRPIQPPRLEYNYSYYPVIFSDHNSMMEVREKLNEQGIFPRRYFNPSLNTLPFLNSGQRRDCPVSEDLATRVLSLPLYVGLSSDQIARICQIITT
jgi:dTDP-4-amino-4,6-dideoxygalactose transaminase